LAVGIPVRVVGDTEASPGPLVALAAGLAAVSDPVVLLVAGDMPLLVPDVLRRLVDVVAAAPAALAAALLADGERAPLPLALHRDQALARVTELVTAGERALRPLVNGDGVREIPEAEWRRLDADGDTLVDVDTPADMERLQARTPR
jgi:molybdopterin-guanine dinucleotide biosynthesis protein A